MRQWAIGLLFVGLAALASGLAQADPVLQDPRLEEQALKLERQLMSPCCYGGTVAEHGSQIAMQIRRDIRERLRQGMTPDQISDLYVARYGKRILAAPPAQGFHVLAYVLPPLFLIGGLLILLMVLKRLRNPAQPLDQSPSEPVTSELVERVERELQLQKIGLR